MHTTTTGQRHSPFASAARPTVSHRIRLHLSWFAAGAVMAFLVPYVFTALLSLNHDLYYLIYFAVTLSFLAAYVARTDIDVVALFRDNWRWSLGIGALSAAFVVTNVLSRDSTDGPSGLYAVFEVGWRGLAYGVVDALLLTAFPAAVATSLVAQRITGIGERLRAAAIMLPLVLIITAVYHLGYEQFREDGIGPPEFGNTVISAPAFATGNPLGSVFAHASMHITADIHAYETDVFLPPQTDAPD